MRPPHPTQQDKDGFMAYLGKRAVYQVTGFLAPVTIEEIHFEPHFEARLAAIDGITLCSSEPGFKMETVFSVSAAWECLRVEPDSWSFAQSGCVWRVILKETACAAVLRLCKERPGLDPKFLYQQAKWVSGDLQHQPDPDTVAEVERQIMESFRRLEGVIKWMR